MTQSQQSFTSDTGAALEQAMALLQQKGLIIQKYMQKMGYQQSKIEQLVEEIQRLNWENREREYNEQLVRKVPLKDLIQQGFVEVIEIGGGDVGNNEQVGNKQLFSNNSSSSSRSIQVKGNNDSINGYQQIRRLYVIRVMVDEQSEEILLTNNMHLLKDNNYYKNIHSQPLLMGNKNILIDQTRNYPNFSINSNNNKQPFVNGIGLKTNVNTNDQQSQQLIESYCQSVLRQVQEMKEKLLSQSQYTSEKVIQLREENLQLKQHNINMEKSIIQMKQAHRQEMMQKQSMIDQIVKQSQAKLGELKQIATKTQAYLMQQLKLRVSQINDVNQHFANETVKYQQQLEEKDSQLQQKVKQIDQKTNQIQQLNSIIKDITKTNEQQLTQMNKQIQQKTNQISILQQQIQHLKSLIIKQHQKQQQKQHSIILQKEKSSTYQKKKQNIIQKCCQTDPQLVLDIDFLRKTKLEITKRREEMREMKLSPENVRYNMNNNNNNNEYSSYKVIQQTHKDAQSVQYKICLPPSLDVIAFDFQHSVSSSANVSPQRRFSNHNVVNNNKSEQQQSFYSNQRRIQEMYTIPKERHNHMKHYQHQIRHNNNNNGSHMQTQRNKYMSQPTIPLEFSHSNSNQQGRGQQYVSSSQQSDRIRVTPESEMGMMVIDQSNNKKDNQKDEIHERKQPLTQQKPHSKRHQQHQPPFIKQLHTMKPKVASYSQKNIIMQEMNQDDQHHQLIGAQKNQLQKIHKHSSHDTKDKQQQHKINYVNVAHHYHHHNNHHHAQQKQAYLKIHHTNTMNDIDVIMTNEVKEHHNHNHHHNQQHPNQTNLKQRRSDELIPSRSALTESSASSIREISPPYQRHEIQDQKLFDMNYFDDDAIIDENLQNSDHPSETYKNSLRFPNGYCSGSMDKIPHKQHNEYHQSNQLSKSIGYDLHHDISRKRHPFNTQYKNAKQLLQFKSPQIVMKSLIDKSFPIQKNPFKLSNEFINVAELLQQQKKDTTQKGANNNNNYNNNFSNNYTARTKVDYLTVVNRINKSSNPGSDSLINIMIDSNQQHHDHVQVSTSMNHDTTKQKQSQQKIVQNVNKNQGNKNYPTNKASNFKTPKKHKTIQLTESLDFESLRKIQTQDVGQRIREQKQEQKKEQQQQKKQQNNTNTNTKSKKKQKIIYLRR